jgi:hypothetical protein
MIPAARGCILSAPYLHCSWAGNGCQALNCADASAVRHGACHARRHGSLLLGSRAHASLHLVCCELHDCCDCERCKEDPKDVAEFRRDCMNVVSEVSVLELSGDLVIISPVMTSATDKTVCRVAW